jgi:branched-chain amino acid aminotransferase
MLYIADEVFFVGTAVEVVAVRSVDKIAVGSGRKGPVTAALEARFFDIVNGRVPDKYGWLQYLDRPVAAATH